MEMITKKLMEKSSQGTSGALENNNNIKAGVSLEEAKKKNDEENGCCSL